MIRFGITIRELRLARQLSLRDLAAESGLTASFLSLVENERREPSLTVLRRIALALDVPEEAILWKAVEIPDDVTGDDRRVCLSAKKIVQRLLEDTMNDGGSSQGGMPELDNSLEH